jgi:hypothetical protein
LNAKLILGGYGKGQHIEGRRKVKPCEELKSGSSPERGFDAQVASLESTRSIAPLEAERRCVRL